MKQNALLFIAAVALSLMLWLQVGTLFEPQVERVMTVKLEMQGLPREFVTVFPPSVIEVTAKGTTTALQRIRDGDIRAKVDLADVKETGTKYARVQVTGPPDVGAILTPGQKVVPFSIDREESLPDRPVTILPVGEAPRGVLFEPVNARVIPQKVRVRGPSTLLVQVVGARVRLNLAALSTGDTVSVPVEVVGADGEALSGLRAEPAEVTVDPRAVQAPSIKTVVVNPTYSGQLPPGYELVAVRVVPNQVELRGSTAGSLEGVVRVLTEAISLEGVTASVSRRTKIRRPLDVTAEPDEVEVILQVAKVGKP